MVDYPKDEKRPLAMVLGVEKTNNSSDYYLQVKVIETNENITLRINISELAAVLSYDPSVKRENDPNFTTAIYTLLSREEIDIMLKDGSLLKPYDLIRLSYKYDDVNKSILKDEKGLFVVGELIIQRCL